MTSGSAARLAIIGCGVAARDQFLAALKKIDWQPVVLVDPIARNREAIAQRVGKSGEVAAYADWSDVVGAFDAAIVATPNAAHGVVGTALARAGKHIFVDAPLATTVEQGRAILAAAQQAGNVLFASLPRRRLHITRWTEALIRSERLGSINRIHLREGSMASGDACSDTLLRQENGGVLMLRGPHVLDLVTWWFGDVARFEYADDSRGGIAAECTLDCEFRSGARGHIELSNIRELGDICLIEGSEGFVEVHLARNEVTRCSENVRRFTSGGIGVGAFPAQEPCDLLEWELAAFRASIAQGIPPPVSPEAALASICLAERSQTARTPIVQGWQSAHSANKQRPSIRAGMKVVLTGATGFIGGHLAERLIELGADVVCLVRSYGSATRLARLPLQIQRVDLTDVAAIDAALAGAEVVFNCALDWNALSRNITATRNLIAACLAHHVERLVHLSSFSVYDPLPDGMLNEESSKTKDAYDYGGVKSQLEKEILASVANAGLRATILQPTIVYGPFSKPWTIDPAELMLDGTVVLPGRGAGLCNALHVDDLVDAMLLAAQRDEAVGETFIISGPAPITWSDFYQAVADALGIPGPQYWPPETIARQNSGVARAIKVVMTDPSKLFRLATKVPIAGPILEKGMNVLPSSLGKRVRKVAGTTGTRPRGGTHVPSPGQVAFFSAKPIVSCDKARRLLGYVPTIDFASGMEPTSRYLQWAYEARIAERVSPSSS